MDEDHTYFVATASGDEAVWVHNEWITIPLDLDPNCHKPNQVPTTPAQSSPGTWELLKAVAIGLNEGYEQGKLNLLNGGTDLAIHTADTVVQVTPSIWVLNWMGVDTTIPAPDWSRDLVCPESDSVHWWSKFSGEIGLGLVGPKFGKTVPKGGPTPPPLPGPTVAAAEVSETTVIGKLSDLKNLQSGEKTLLSRLPKLRTDQAQWYQNSSVLREEMSKLKPIRDASTDAMGNLINDTGFLKAERNVLRQHGWWYDQITHMWNPPL